MSRFGVLCWPVGRAEVLKTVRAEGEGDENGVEDPVVSIFSLPPHFVV